MELLNAIVFYSLILLITFLIYKIVIGFINLFFKYKIKRATSLTYPIIKGMSILLTAFLTRVTIGEQVITILISFINENMNWKIENPVLSNSSSVIGEIFFYFSITVITIIYTVFAFKKQKEFLLKTIKEEPIPIKVEFPENTYDFAPNFEDRIKKIFELKYEKQKVVLTWDYNFEVLYGSYVQGLHNYGIVIFCKKGKEPTFVKEEAIVNVNKIISEVINKDDLLKTADIIEKFYLIEKGSFELNKVKISCYSEDDLLDSLIDFTDYLKSLAYKFKHNKLAFSFRSNVEKQVTLSQTFIEPNFLIGKDKKHIYSNLKTHIDFWLSTDDNKHLVMLGDYGMGKSSFSKFYSASLANEILKGDKVKRFPVFISLTNTSPRHGGIEHAIGKFLADNIGVSSKVFYELVNRGKIVFILDGFDEMGFVDTHSQRVKQLNAIWKLATKNNKILISGRPSYFPNDKELQDVFKLKEHEQIAVPSDKPYFERMYLHEFDIEQIENSIQIYDYNENDKIKYIEFIKNSKSIMELCKRPSMMHIVREMLPTLFINNTKDDLNPGDLMDSYINHWLERQLHKEIVSAVENDKIKKEFTIDFFIDLAAEYYIQGVDGMPAKTILGLLKDRMYKLNLISNNDIEGFESEILTGYFIEIENDEYKFVHKSFKEYLISRKIVQLIVAKDFKNPLINEKQWTKEIIDFVYDSNLIDKSRSEDKRVPLLLYLSGEKELLIKTKCYLFRLYVWGDTILDNVLTRGSNSIISTYEFFNSKRIKQRKEKIAQILRNDKDISETEVLLKYFKSDEKSTFSKSLNDFVYSIINERINSKKMSTIPKFFYISLVKNQLRIQDEKKLVDFLERNYRVTIRSRLAA